MTHIDQISEVAIERLWREHSHDLVGLATMLVGPADAHDIAVESFLRAAPAADQPEVSNARTFLMRSVVNRAHDLRRSNERRWRRDLAAVGPVSTCYSAHSAGRPKCRITGGSRRPVGVCYALRAAAPVIRDGW
jgi:DNA-directed RNA polymerase specialized sigma24 family protein